MLFPKDLRKTDFKISEKLYFLWIFKSIEKVDLKKFIFKTFCFVSETFSKIFPHTQDNSGFYEVLENFSMSQ